MVSIENHIKAWTDYGFGETNSTPWAITKDAAGIINNAIENTDDDFIVKNGIAVHRSSVVENGAILKAPVLIGSDCYVAANSYLRGGVFLSRNCIVGPSCELKTVFMFDGSKVAHLSFVGDSIIGSNVNIEAGAIVANYRNELEDKEIILNQGGNLTKTGVTKFGSLIGDDTKVGANAVLAPGTILPRQSIVGRLSHVDQLKS